MSQDAEVFTLTCRDCGNRESSRVKDRGGAGIGNEINWTTPSFGTFDADVVGGGFSFPVIKRATCTKCGSSTATTESISDWPTTH